MICMPCDVLQDFDNFQTHIGGITGEAGTYVRVGTVGDWRYSQLQGKQKNFIPEINYGRSS